MNLSIGSKETLIERQTYSILDWVGDVGGLMDGLRIIAVNLVAPLAALNLKAELLKSIYDPAKQLQQSWIDGRNMKNYCKSAKYRRLLDTV